MPEMDYEGFHLSSPDGLSIIMTAYTTGSKDPFPIDMIYGPWVHTSGQVSTVCTVKCALGIYPIARFLCVD